MFSSDGRTVKVSTNSGVTRRDEFGTNDSNGISSSVTKVVNHLNSRGVVVVVVVGVGVVVVVVVVVVVAVVVVVVVAVVVVVVVALSRSCGGGSTVCFC